MIFWSIFGFFHSLGIAGYILAGVAVILYALFKNLNAFLVAVAFLLICFISFDYIPHLRWVSLSVFVVSWIGQFIGHHIEGKRPSFLKDLAFLLIGPLWVLKKFFPNLY